MVAAGPAPRMRSFRIWSAVHTWASLVATAFLLMLCLTGLPLIFHEELDQWLGYAPEPPALPSGTPPLPLDRIVAAAAAKRPGEVVQFVGFDRDEPDVVAVGLSRTLQTLPSDSYLDMDRRTGDVLLEKKPGTGPVAALLTLHTNLFLGLPGKLFLGLMGLCLVLAVISGIVLYGPFMRSRAYGTVRHGRPARIRWLDWHNLVGVSTLAWALVVGATGTVNTWSDLVLGLWQRGQLAEMTAATRDAPRPAVLASLDAAVSTAQAAAPGMRVQFIAFPGTPFSSTVHYAIFMAGETPLTSRLFKPALVDGGTGALTGLRDMPLSMQGFFLSQPLHFGNYGGLPLKVVWALFDLATILVLGSGLFLWIARMRAAR
jgi:uncharacterized iron-regulated membrane protein